MNEENERQRDTDVVDAPKQTAENETQAQERSNEKPAPAAPVEEGLAPLFEMDAAEKFRTRWLSIQSKFVDDPSDSVKQADDLVTDVIQNITRSFADRRSSLEKQWNGGGNTSTEDLRIALKQYRSFFERLLTLQS